MGRKKHPSHTSPRLIWQPLQSVKVWKMICGLDAAVTRKRGWILESLGLAASTAEVTTIFLGIKIFLGTWKTML